MSTCRNWLYIDLVLIISSCIYSALGQSNCSALSAYVQITEPVEHQATILSSYALFSPYFYGIPSTEAVRLSGNSNDICTGSLTTDITDKILLILPHDGNCSFVQKIYGAQINGAIAVLIANPDPETGAVVPIINDETAMDEEGNLIEITIPARMIPYNAAIELRTNIDGPDILKIEFACNSTLIGDDPQTFCVVDESGDHWWMDGDYQLQIGKKKNGHSIWMKDGYLLVLNVNHYIFLHADEDDYYWAISEDPQMIDDTLIVAFCTKGSLLSPMDCPLWKTTDYFITGALTFTENPNVKINNTLCSITDNFICIQSTQSSLHGLSGTYRQFQKNTAYWFREWIDCDTSSGYLTFFTIGDSGVFQLIDPLDNWVIAENIIDGYTSEELEATYRLHPELFQNWTSLVDGSLDAAHKPIDKTMSITVGECEVVQCPPDSTIPNKLCMARNSIMHSFLEGDYRLTGNKGDRYGTSEWIRTDLQYYDGDYIPIFVWYYGEVNKDLPWWVISPWNLTKAMQYNGSSVYGWCPSNTLSPANCLSCWNFYFSGHEDIAGAWHSDCNFDMAANECDEETDSDTVEYEWPSYLCIRDNVTALYDGSVNFDFLIGGYEKSDTWTPLSGVPHWVKPPNDYTSNWTYIYYDGFYGYWQIGNEIHVDADLFCMQRDGDYLPTHCKAWYDIESNKLGNVFLYATGCTEDDMLKLTVKDTKKSNNNAAIIVLVILAVIAVVVAGFFYFKYYQKNKGKGGFVATRVSSADIANNDVELGDDMGLVAGHSTKGGGMDMSPLNTDGPIATRDEDESEEDEDMTVDAQQNDIVDDQDDEERLIANNPTDRGDYDDEEENDLRLPSDHDDGNSPDPNVDDD